MRRNNLYRFKSNLYRFKPNKNLKFKIGAVIIGVIIMFSVIRSFPHFVRNTYIVTIANKQIKKENNTNKYFIYTEMENGDTKVFENSDSVLEFKFNSVDIYGGIRINRKYEVKTYGFNIPILSLYQNIIKVRAIK